MSPASWHQWEWSPDWKSGTAHLLHLPNGIEDRSRTAILVIGPPLRVYLNECAHIPVPLDILGEDFFDSTRTYLMCRTHGALFRPSDGYCVRGPCTGESLTLLEVEAIAGKWLRLRIPEVK